MSLLKIFIINGSCLFHQNEIEHALKEVDQDIRWFKEKNSYYYLINLFNVKSFIFKENKEISKSYFLLKTFTISKENIKNL